MVLPFTFMELYGWKQGLYDCIQYAQRVWISSSRSLKGLHKYSFFWVYVVVNIFGRINNSGNLVRNMWAEFKVLREVTLWDTVSGLRALSYATRLPVPWKKFPVPQELGASPWAQPSEVPATPVLARGTVILYLRTQFVKISVTSDQDIQEPDTHHIGHRMSLWVPKQCYISIRLT